MFHKIFPNPKPIIGMIALSPLTGDPEVIVKHAMRDLEVLQQEGIDGVCIENDFDQPHQITVDRETASAFTRIAVEIRRSAKVPVGVQVLLNDWRASLTIAKTTNVQFVRLDFFVDRVRIAAGIIKPEPETILAYRKEIGAKEIALFTDIQVKHSELLESGKSLTTSAHQAIAHGSDAIIVTGQKTGIGPTLEDLKEVRQATGDFPILVGSGATPENIRELFRYADAAIVGTAFKERMAPYQPVIAERVKKMMDEVRKLR